MDKITVKHISENEIQEKGIRTWSTWSCDKSEFRWEYSEKESCYIMEGQVEVTTESGETVSFGPGDFVVFPQGLSCTWNVKAPVRKHYNFG